MADLDRIVEVNISRETVTPSLESFSGILIAAEFLKSLPTLPFGDTERVRSYGSAAEVLAAGFTSDTFVYRAAQRVFAQNPAVSVVYVGRKKTGGDGSETWDVALNAMLLASAGWYGVCVSTRLMAEQAIVADWVESNKKFCVLASGDQNIVDGANDENYATITLSGEVLVSSTITTVVNGTSIATAFSVDHATTMTAHIAAINAKAEMIAAGVSAAPGTNNKIIVLSALGLTMVVTCAVTGGATNPTAAIVYSALPHDIAVYLKENNISRTGVFYDPLAGNGTYEDCIDAAVLGKLFPKAPGSATYAFKQLSLVTVYILQPAEITRARSKNANIYTSIAGVACTQMGTVGSGEYMDVMTGLDWLTANIQNQVFTPMVRADKIPFTDDGVQMIVTPLKAALNDGVINGVISGAPGDLTVSWPKVASVSAVNKGNRTLPSVTFQGVLAGAIHKVVINGTVTA
jgi:hypothetical protein